MATVTLNYDARNETLQKLINFITSLNGVTVEKNPKGQKYSKEFVEKVEAGRKDIQTGNTTKIAIEDLWK